MKLPKNFGGQGFGAMMEQAKAAMARAQDLEEELERERIGIDRGPVKAVFDGTGQLLKISLDPSVIDPEDIETLEDLIVSTVKAGFTQATELRNARVQSIVPNVPGLDI
ncbi:MAG: nucleoid-associated protein EbfC [Fimbriimonadaceae bacterium]|jgi:DNA-binding YbaB/EbfC family protein|nr:nucleoid-associated protein EbfC [Fimbriimonadaceae bacterium]